MNFLISIRSNSVAAFLHFADSHCRWFGLAARHGHMGARYVLACNSSLQETDLTQETVTKGLPLMIGASSQ